MLEAELPHFSAHMDHSPPTKVGRSQAHGIMEKRMRRELLPRAPEVSVVTHTIYASEPDQSR